GTTKSQKPHFTQKNGLKKTKLFLPYDARLHMGSFRMGGMKIQINDELQLTLSLPNRTATGRPCRLRPRQRRLARAALWFNHMRHIVDHAHDWLPATVPSEAGHQTKSE